MTQPDCAMPRDELLAWWLGELDTAGESRLDAHVFTCAECTSRLTSLVTLGDAIRREILSGSFGFVVPAAFVDRMRTAGLTLREYTVASGGSVNCTIGPRDDFVIAHLHAPLAGVLRLDVLIDDTTAGQFRLDDVPFDPVTGQLTVVPSAAFLRSLGTSRQRLRLVAVAGGQERALGDYTFNHTPS
jgi:hypothetical protein